MNIRDIKMLPIGQVVWWLNGTEIVCTTIECIRISLTRDGKATFCLYTMAGYGCTVDATDLFMSLADLLTAKGL